MIFGGIQFRSDYVRFVSRKYFAVITVSYCWKTEGPWKGCSSNHPTSMMQSCWYPMKVNHDDDDDKDFDSYNTNIHNN